jgi:hypothetical protein
MYSGRAAYISGVKHQGKMPWMTISVTLARDCAMICQPCTTTRRYGSLAGQALCSESVFTLSGYLAAGGSPRAVHLRLVTCVSVTDNAKYKGVTQVISVNSC